LDAWWTGMEDHTICILLHFDHLGHHKLHPTMSSSTRPHEEQTSMLNWLDAWWTVD
ncbi:hypothetical protein A2U01_0001646, partial [Trifolium medium]|nr:hypothetical protein [Trifolium medium]